MDFAFTETQKLSELKLGKFHQNQHPRQCPPYWVLVGNAHPTGFWWAMPTLLVYKGTIALIFSKSKTVANCSSVIKPFSRTICRRDLPVSKDSLATAAAFK